MIKCEEEKILQNQGNKTKLVDSLLLSETDVTKGNIQVGTGWVWNWKPVGEAVLKAVFA